MKKKKLVIIPVLILTVVAICASVGYSMLGNSKEFKFGENVFINGERVRGYSKEKAYEVVNKSLHNKLDDTKVVLVYNDTSWDFDTIWQIKRLKRMAPKLLWQNRER